MPGPWVRMASPGERRPRLDGDRGGDADGPRYVVSGNGNDQERLVRVTPAG